MLARLLLVLTGALALPALAADALLPTPPAIGAASYVLVDFHSGQVLAEQDAHRRIEPASLTKLMTGYAVFHELKAGRYTLETPVRISEKAWRAEGSRTFVEVGTQVSVRDLLLGMIVQSGNDATIALAEFTSGSEDAFAALMNRYAERLGMADTRFVNATGLPHPDHHSSAADLGRLAAAIIREFPQEYAWYAQKSHTYNNITQYNRNLLLWRDASVDGVKTGHTDSAGYCLVSSALRDGMRLIAVVTGSRNMESRAQESLALLNFGFRTYETRRLYAAHAALSTDRIWKGAEQDLPLGLEQDLYVTIPRGQYARLAATLEVGERIMAPVSAGATLGRVRVQIDDRLIAERPLVALHAVATGGLLRRLADHVSLWFH